MASNLGGAQMLHIKSTMPGILGFRLIGSNLSRSKSSRLRLFKSYSTYVHDQWNALTSTVDSETNQSLTYVAKDNISTKIGPTTCASKILVDYTSPFDATVVSLLNESGAKMVGKANMDEFGMGSFNANSCFGPVVNPRFEDPHSAGGSSGGSAASVAAKIADFALGTDTGGSVRLPAAYCQVYGFKPSYGRISRWGVVAYAQSFDVVGILASSVATIKNIFSIVDKHDKKDPTSLDDVLRSKFPQPSSTPKVIGIPEEFRIAEISPEVREAWLETLEKLTDLGHSVVSVSLPSIKLAIPAYYTLCTAEAASNLARYDGVRYGSRGDSIADARSQGLGEEVQRRIILGNYTLSSSSGAHYLRATKIRQELVEEFNGVFREPNVVYGESSAADTVKCDYLVCPVSTTTAPLLDNHETEVREYVNDVFTIPPSMAGLPALSVPVKGVGIQVIGQFGDDLGVLDFGEKIA